MLATWAVHHQRGPDAVRVVERAFATAQRAKARALREAAIRAIFNMLDGTLRQAVHKLMIDFSKIPEGPVHKYIREKFEELGEKRGKKLGEKRGEAEALLRVLAARGFPVSAATRKRVLACDDKHTLDRWIDRAVTATALKDVFGAPAAARPKRKPASPAR